MANNVQAEAVVSAGTRFLTAEVTGYGDASTHIPGCFMAIVSGSEGAQTFAELTGGAGAVSAGTQRVTLASDDPAVVALQILDNAISGSEMQVDVVGALPAGTNAIGKLAANSGVDIGDVTINGPLGGGVEAGAVLVTIASDSTGVLSIDDNGASLTVDGTVAATQSGTWTVDLGATDNAVLDAIAASLAGTLTVGSHAVTNAGTFAVQVDGAALTALQLIDDVIYTDDAAFTPATSKVLAIGFQFDDSLTDPVDEGDIGAPRMSETRVMYTQIRDHTSERGVSVNALNRLSVSVDNTASVIANCVNGGTFAVQVTGDGLTALQLIDDIVHVDDAAFTLGTHSGVMAMGFAGTQSVDANDAAALACTTAGQLLTVPQAHTAGGCSIFRSIDIDESEEEVKATAGQVYGIYAINTTAATLYLKLYNLTAANTTVGTSTPVMTLPVPGDDNTDGAGFYLSFPVGVAFDTAISVACTTAVADADTGAPGANACIVQVFYK